MFALALLKELRLNVIHVQAVSATLVEWVAIIIFIQFSVLFSNAEGGVLFIMRDQSELGCIILV
jgi:hypothetical protein